MNISNSLDRITLMAKYEKIGVTKGNMAIVRHNKKFGIIDINGIEVIECKYKHLYLAPKSYYYRMSKGLNNNPYLYIGIIDGRKEYILPSHNIVFNDVEVDTLTIRSDRELIITKNGICSLYSLIDLEVKFSGFDEIEPMSLELYKVRKDDKWGICDIKGEITVPLTYDAISDHGDNIFAVCKNNQYGIINRNNEIIVPLQYTEISQLNSHTSNNTYLCLTSLNYQNPQFRIYDVKNRKLSNIFLGVVVRAPFGLGHYFWVRFNDSYKLMHQDGSLILSMLNASYFDLDYLYDGLYFIEDGVSYVYRTKKFGGFNGITSHFSKEIINDEILLHIQTRCHFDAIYAFDNNDITRIVKGQKYGLITKTGDILVTPTYDAIFNFKRGFASINKSGKWGVINDKGDIVVPCIFDGHVIFKDNDSFFVRLNGQRGVYNSQIGFRSM